MFFLLSLKTASENRLKKACITFKNLKHTDPMSTLFHKKNSFIDDNDHNFQTLSTS